MPGRRRSGRLLGAAAALAAAGAAAFWLATAPRRPDPALTAGLQGDAARGALVFRVGGCAACHAAPGAEPAERPVLSGGRRFVTPFGTFTAPNVSPHPEAGIGAWSLQDFAAAMLRGVGRDGRHLYPAFPYVSYARMTPQDVADLWAWMRALPPSDSRPPGHDLPFPFNIRRGLGLWKLLALDPSWVVDVPADDALAMRGRYLVEGPGHCAECHTPRNALGVLDRARWLQGAPNPDGPGVVPDITPGPKGIGGWSEEDIAWYLESGFTPDYDSVGGSMAEVVRNLSGLPKEDLRAIAAYLKAVPPSP
ncbi:c-type cytochrome [Oceanicella actignis]|uniref:Cytochrome c, mono-and diheme variants n=1 Tax=Oceanicella actignis TaxID=1189325 RepID=A0A1M7SGX0_9RHOB|nr:cytochrome c [Oceanicella actignis]TYO91246.1 mono/diheme cytochrome c family protein [Oceanicella actignis]SET20496.1 Cytochrome c, mono-and diheme variants [Oceanicella actignis]SHN57735.1 Cytochrome c, mono-and diheme variants [Oceanicella actignis]